MKTPHIIAITGASSGLGAALAKHYANAGNTLYLQGRNAARLEEVAHLCRAQAATVHSALLDVTDHAATQNWLLAADAANPIDLVIANAGISAGSGALGESAQQLRQVFAVNIDGVVNSVQPLLPVMAQRGQGQIAIISSLAGLRGLPSCPSYSASKACIRTWGEGLRGVYARQGVGISVICPGYIATPMTHGNPFPMPFIMSAEKAASIVARGLAQNKSRIAFPRILYWPLWWLACLPNALTDWFFARLPAKPNL